MIKRTRGLLRAKDIFIGMPFVLALIFFGGCGSKGKSAGEILPQAKQAKIEELKADLFETDILGAGEQAMADPQAIMAALKSRLKEAPSVSTLVVDYPQNRSLFPPDMCSPMFLFRDPDQKSNQWLIRVSFENNPSEIFVLTHGRQPEKVYDSRCAADVNEWTEPETQRSAKAWTPSEKVWGTISQSSEKDVTVRVYGLETSDPARPDSGNGRLVSQGKIVIRISKDPVGAPIFYRDVPLMPSRNVKGVIEPLSQDAIPLICWRLRDLRKPESRIVLKTMPTCGNCHSFSNEGRTLGMDMDGPSGDKGAYAIAPVQKNMVIKRENVMTWNAFHKDKPTFGLFSRVSPDGKYVVSGIDESVFVVNYLDFRFLQIFYPTRSVLAYYNRETREIKTLPGADDPRYVQANPVWSPDGKTIVFVRALAKDNFIPGVPLPKLANDPNENPIKYDLYAVPFNNGKGGIAEPLEGASTNGRSNSFPKFSPDGKWLVFVQANNGLLMRPDSALYIIPAGGGIARRMNCNTPLMNSWHSWSPNSRWLVFSSKSAKPFTVMVLTHVDENGNDSPAILVPNSTAYNRAVNIPEFVNIEAEGIEEIQVPAVEYQIHLDTGEELLRKKEYAKAMAALEKARELKPDYPQILDALGYVLSEKGDLDAAIRYFRQAIEIDKFNIDAYVYLGSALVKKQEIEEALKCFEIAAKLNTMNFNGQAGLAGALSIAGKLDEAVPHYQKALEINPDDLDNRYNYGLTLIDLERYDEALEQFTFVLKKNPQYSKAHRALAVVLNRKGDVAGALRHYEEALRLSPDDLNTLNNLAWLLAVSPDRNLRNGARALELAQELCSKTEYKMAGALDTLAAAFAQVGKFEEAVKWASRSLELTPPSDPNIGIRSKLLALYKEKKTL